MKKLLILLLLVLSFKQVNSQNEIVSITIPIDSVIVKKDKILSNVYNIYLNIKSNDKRFFLDMYSFQVINSISFDELPFEDLKEVLEPKNLLNELSLKELEKKEPCSVHEIFSLTNLGSSNIYLVKQENGTLFVWRMSYLGTSKNGGITDY